MARYGQIIDDTFIPERDDIYNMFCDYFNNPIMTKIKNEDSLSMYITKTYCLTSMSCRYIISFVQIDTNPIGSEQPLESLKWVSLQTRTLENKYNSKSHGYQPTLEGPLLAKIERHEITKEASTYFCETFPIKVTLLHTNKNTSMSYQQKGNIINALETWETIITWK